MLDIFPQAWRDTRWSFGLKWQSFVHYVVLPGLAVFLLWLFLGRKQAMDEVWVFGCYLAAVFLLFVFSFGWNLWLAPYRLLNEKMDQRSVRHPSSPDYRQPNVKHWEGTKTFKLGDAACLWVGVRPHDPIEDDRAAGKLAQLSGAMMRGEIPYNPAGGLRAITNLMEGKRPWPEYSHPISAVALRKYAGAVNDVPPFLQSIEVPPDPEPVEEKDSK